MLFQLFLIHISRLPEMYLDHFSAILGFTFDSAQCNRKSAICGLKIPSGQRSRSPSLTKRIAASGNEIARRVQGSAKFGLVYKYCGTAVYLTDLRLYRLVENCLALPSQQLPLCTSEYREKHRNPNSSLIATGLQDRTN